MYASAIFGLLLGMLLPLLRFLLGPEVAFALLWTATAIQLTIAALVVWRRMRIPLFAAVMGQGAVVSSLFLMLAAFGLHFPELLFDYWWFMLPSMAVGPALLWMSARRHPEEWRRWGEHMNGCTLSDLLMLRHIPDWHSSRTVQRSVDM